MIGLSLEKADERYLKGSSKRTVLGKRKWICRFGRDLRQEFRNRSIQLTTFQTELLPSVVNITRSQAIEIMISKRFVPIDLGLFMVFIYFFSTGWHQRLMTIKSQKCIGFRISLINQ